MEIPSSELVKGLFCHNTIDIFGEKFKESMVPPLCLSIASYRSMGSKYLYDVATLNVMNVEWTLKADM